MQTILQHYKATIGLEIHAQLNTKRKMFCPEGFTFGGLPNTMVSCVTLAHPGTLPVPNIEAIKKCVTMGLACKSTITNNITFYRKNYSYPDLPKGFQITQGEEAICRGGKIKIKLDSGYETEIALHRIHLEEDTGKSIHNSEKNETYLDFNRAGVPLIEIVTEPCITTPEEAYQFLTEIRKIVRYLEICDGNMEEGSMRCDVNISISKYDSPSLGTRVEIKNLNSIRNVKLSIEAEIKRHYEILQAGGTIYSETLTYDPETNTTKALRNKDTSKDYRYFPEPNIPPIILSDSDISAIKAEMPLLPSDYITKFTTTYKLSHYDASVLTSIKELALFFDNICKHTTNFKAAANWTTVQIKAHINDFNITMQEFNVAPEKIAEIINLVDSNTISHHTAVNTIFVELIKNPSLIPKEIATQHNLLQSTDITDLKTIVLSVITEFSNKVQEYRAGKTGVIEMLMGQIIKKSRSQYSPKTVRDVLIDMLNR